MKKPSLSERDAKVIWHPYTQHQQMQDPIGIVRGEGVLLFDETGNSYIDAISSWWVTIHGHAHPLIAERLFYQARQLEQVIFTNFTHEPAVALAERLLQILPGNLSKIFYSDNGSTAVEVALKMAVQYWRNKNKPQRNKIIAFHHAYHGDTFGAMSVSGRGLFTDAFRDLLFDVVFIDVPDSGNIESIRSQLVALDDQVAAFIYEPLIQAAGGMRMYDASSMNQLLGLMRDENILCIADEVLTGFGRTGSLFASEKLEIKPDIICLSKGLTGGTMALGVTACTQKIFNAFLSTDRTRTFFHGHSFTANPLACTAGLASLDLLMEESCRNQIKMIQSMHEHFISAELSETGAAFFMNARVLGTILAFELNSGKNEYINEAGTVIMREGLSQGIYIRPLGNTVYLMPPYCILPEQLRILYQFILSIPARIRKN